MIFSDLQLHFCPYCGAEIKTTNYCHKCKKSFQILTDHASWHPDIISELKWDESATHHQKQIILELISDFVKVDGGTFTMGVSHYKGIELKGYERDWQCPHRVTISPFYISKFLVTQRQWFAFMPPHACENIGEELPVDSISWLDCISFCKKLKQLSGIDFNLPTEAQWFWVAKECNDYALANIENIEEFAWTKNHSNTSKRPGLKRPNKLGVYDLFGNLHEWCLDRWGKWGNSPLTDPYRPLGSGGNMIRKGGSYSMDKPDLFDPYNINARDFRSATAHMHDSGIRLAIFNPNFLNEFNS